ncbi:MAG TPA: ABC transporter substrate-binding protein [Streptosporangiaceae bacterium]|nr:ABC transporter substrate-binding protein [Streptosporangiaceae bacterium]
MTRRFFRIPAIPAAATAVALLAAGCASATGPSPASVEKPDLTVAVVPAADSAGVYIAQQDGLFRQQGLKIKIVPAISSATVIQDQVAGKFDITDGNYVSYIEANAKQNANLEIFAAGSIMQPRCQEIMVMPNSPIKNVADLKGKTIAVNVPNNIGTLLVGALLRDNGMNVHEVHLKVIDFPFMAAALRDHQVDAAWMPEPFVTGAEESVGAVPLADLDAGATQSLPIAGYVVTKTWARKYPKTLAAFERALTQAQRIADTDPHAVEQAMVAYSGVPKTAAAVMASPTFPLDTDSVLIQRIANLMVQFNLIQQPYNVKEMIG